MSGEKSRNVSIHILPAAAGLLAICFVLLSMIKVMDLAGKTLIDEIAAAGTFLFLISSIFSYASIRSARGVDLYERIADIMFFLGLGFLVVVSVIIVGGGIK